MKIGEKIKHLFHRQPRTAEELAAGAEAKAMRDKAAADGAQAVVNHSGNYSGF
jgi:hypothetical protein